MKTKSLFSTPDLASHVVGWAGFLEVPRCFDIVLVLFHLPFPSSLIPSSSPSLDLISHSLISSFLSSDLSFSHLLFPFL